MILAFFIGLAVDIFTTGVLGINAGALTAVAFIRQKMLHAIMDERNMERHDSPDLKVMGVGKGLFYIGVPYLLFFIISVLLDNFSIRPLAITIPKILAGTIVSGVISMLLFKNYKKI
jgi:hypothetical protein